MLAPVRFAVIGEGPDEHGMSSRYPNLHPLPKEARLGCLVHIVARILRERCGRDALPVGWVVPPKNHYSKPPKAVDLLCDGNLLARLLNALLRPVKLSAGEPAADLVVLSVDLDRKTPFKRAERQIPEELMDRVIPLVFEPELEVLFTCSKEPLEDACGLRRCTTTHPERQGDLKRCLERWLHRYANGRPLDSKLRQDIAENLDLGADSRLQEVEAFRELTIRLERWRRTG